MTLVVSSSEPLMILSQAIFNQRLIVHWVEFGAIISHNGMMCYFIISFGYTVKFFLIR